VTAASTADGVELVCVLLGVPIDDPAGNTSSYSLTLLEAAARKAATLAGRVSLVKAGQPLMISGNKLLLVPGRSLTYLGEAGQTADYSLGLPDLSQATAGQVNAGQKTEIQLIQAGQVVASVSATYAEPTPTPTPVPTRKPTNRVTVDPANPGNSTDDHSIMASFRRFIIAQPVLFAVIVIVLILLLIVILFIVDSRRRHRRRAHQGSVKIRRM
jgi:hypothetical protein